jgi:hypothetical protein
MDVQPMVNLFCAAPQCGENSRCFSMAYGDQTAHLFQQLSYKQVSGLTRLMPVTSTKNSNYTACVTMMQ